MKTTKKIVSVTMIVSICFALFAPTGMAEITIHEPKDIWKNPEILAKNAIVSLLQSDFVKQMRESIIDEHGLVEREGKYYPSDYAGAFINEEGILIVCLTTFDAIGKYKEYYSDLRILEIEKMVKDAYPEFARLDIDISECVKYETRMYSFCYLATLQERLYEKMEEFSISETILDEDENVIQVGLKDLEKKEYVENYLRDLGIDIRAVKYYECVGKYEFLANHARIGTEVRDKVNSTTYGVARGSIGFHAKDNNSGEYGVVTAAHVIAKNVATYNKNGQTIGTSSSIVKQVEKKPPRRLCRHPSKEGNFAHLSAFSLIPLLGGVADA